MLPAQEDEPVLCSKFSIRDVCNQAPTDRSSTIINSVVPVVHLPPVKRGRTDRHHNFSTTKRSLIYTPIISPLSSSPVHITSDDDEEPRITLDLTVPSNHNGTKVISYGSSTHSSETSQQNGIGGPNDEEIIAGCNALLSFSSGTSCPVTGRS